jgi:RNA polymerase sigma factor (sigma-70 family)
MAEAMIAAAARVLHDRADVEDALQTARLSLLASFGARPREVDNFVAYALASTTYAAFRVAKVRRQGSQGRQPEDASGTVPDPIAGLEIELTAERIALMECLDVLVPHHRMALIMHSEGMTYREIGIQLGRPADTVRGWLPMIRARMRQCLEGRRHG